ncbi:MAG: hypothetical protein K2J47_07825 [Ruminococcus sp.]|nr:hypothetical protein [Ruminococcus sp.]
MELIIWLALGVMTILFAFFIVFAVLLISAIKKVNKSDSDKLKIYNKKIIFRSIMTVSSLLFLVVYIFSFFA